MVGMKIPAERNVSRDIHRSRDSVPSSPFKHCHSKRLSHLFQRYLPG